MPPITESKSRRSELAKPAMHQCPVCGLKKELKEFYPNKEWTDNDGRDKWCIDCFKSFETKADFKEYFWENNREWDESIWDAAMNAAQAKLGDLPIFKKATKENKKKYLFKECISQLPKLMNGSMYKYLKKTPIEAKLTYAEAVDAKILPEDEPEDPSAKQYSVEFNGYFTQRELEYMTNYYNALQGGKDMEFDTESNRDYARKIAKASLMADKTMNAFNEGRCDISAVKDATALFDMLSKSANLAACKRIKKDDKNEMSSYSQMTQYLEQHGHPCVREINWPKDDVDRTIEEYRYIVQALGLDQV